MRKVQALLLLSLTAVAPADAKPVRHHQPVYRQFFGRNYCPLHRAIDGTLVDCHGVRYRDNYGWDYSCFRLDYLPSQTACSAP